MNYDDKPDLGEENTAKTDGKFTFSTIHRYIAHSTYPEGLSKADKNALRRRAKFFRVIENDIYYVGRGKVTDIRTCGNEIPWVGTGTS